MNNGKLFFYQYIDQSALLWCLLLWCILAGMFVLIAYLNPAPAAAAMTEGAMGQHQPAIAWQRLEKLLEKRTFKSQEELFQLLYILHAREKATGFRLEQETISRLDKRIKTLFPLGECRLIEVRDSRIVFEFAKGQEVAIPHTWRQASLAMPERLVLRIDEGPAGQVMHNQPVAPAGKDGPEGRAIRFTVEQGYLRLHFSFLLKFLGGKMRDAEGSELVYLIDEAKKTSRLQLVELTPLKDGSLKIAKPQKAEKRPETLWIDILHPDFPSGQDIGIAEKTVSFLGTQVELLPDYRIRIGEGEPQQNREAWEWFTNNIKLFREYARTGRLTSQIDYSRNFGYYFEERQIVMNLGFSGSDKVP